MNEPWFISAEAIAEKRKKTLLTTLESERKTAEAEGVTINGVPYSGDPDNRAALLESVQFAREAGIETFAKWKDSSGGFHPDYPLANVEAGLHAIANRRGKLIEREAQYAAQVEDGTLTSAEGLDWEV